MQLPISHSLMDPTRIIKANQTRVCFLVCLLALVVNPSNGAAPDLHSLTQLGGMMMNAVLNPTTREAGGKFLQNLNPASKPASLPLDLGGADGFLSHSPDLAKLAMALMQCDPTAKGLCCVMPNYCHSEADCTSDALPENLIEISKMVPQCACRAGYSGDGLSRGEGCNNIDECLTNNAGCDQVCTDFTPGYACACHPGYTLHADRHTCVDVDECALGTHNCAQSCMNTDGGFKCACGSGFQLADNGFDCEDIDECAVNDGKGPCENECKNTLGGFHCVCPFGYKHSEKTVKCEDVDECQESESPVCDQICINTAGSFDCACHSGYRMTLEGKCEDVDECTIDNGGCTHTCRNKPGSYQCSCPAGYILDAATGRKCEDIDECTLGLCSHLCMNLPGTFTCSCPPGYTLGEDGYTCIDNDECSENTDDCGPQQTCRNTPGSFLCDCPSGFEPDPQNKIQCVDIDECVKEDNPCPLWTRPCCRNSAGSFECEAKTKVIDFWTRHCEDDTVDRSPV